MTGAARGIGRAIALALASAGADVVVDYYNNPEQAAAVVAEIEQLDRRGVAVQADVSDPEQVRRLIGASAAALGGLDIVVNNAGVISEMPFTELPVEEWDRVMAVNLRGVFLVSQETARLMIRQRSGGAIVSIASQLGHVGGVHTTHYATSKAGVISLTRSLAKELAPYSIRINAVAPGAILTDLTRPYATDEWVAAKVAGLAQRRMGTPEDVAASVVFLCTDAASLYTGQTLDPNGGGVMS